MTGRQCTCQDIRVMCLIFLCDDINEMMRKNLVLLATGKDLVIMRENILLLQKKRNRDKFLEQVKSKPGFLLCEEYP